MRSDWFIVIPSHYDLRREITLDIERGYRPKKIGSAQSPQRLTVDGRGVNEDGFSCSVLGAVGGGVGYGVGDSLVWMLLGAVGKW